MTARGHAKIGKTTARATALATRLCLALDSFLLLLLLLLLLRIPDSRGEEKGRRKILILL